MDLLAAHQLKEALLASLWRREREGGERGSFVSISLLASGVSALANQGTGYLRGGVVPQRMGSDHPSICPYGTVFECSDGGLVTLAVGSDKQFAMLCKALGRPELSADERFSINSSRVANREACKEAVRALVGKVARPELLSMLRQLAVPAGGVNDIEAVFEQPQAEALVVRGSGGEALGVRQVAYDERSARADGGRHEVVLAPPPSYGEHTVEVLTAQAGLSHCEVATLIEAGAAAVPDA